MMLKLTGRRISASDLEISGKQLEQILNSYNELQEKYSDLIKIIEEDPALKESIEKKLAEERNKKSNL
jgi:DNA gyrase/topoisomerase IV subunit A